MTIPHNRPTLGAEEASAAGRVIASNWLAQGREVGAFEDEFCAFLGLPSGHAVAVSSGSSALFLALWANAAASREVVQPAYACAALSNATQLCGAIPKYVDNAAGSPNIERAALSPGALAIVVHMFGMPLDVRNAGATVIEDCAQALGARVGNMPVGLQGVAGVFSFYATKLMTSGGQGGMVVSRDKAMIDEIRDYREFDCRADHRPRFNFQMTDLAAAIGRVQLQKLPAFLARRQEIFQRYRQAGIPLLGSALGGDLAEVRYRAVVLASSPERLIASLADAGIKAIVPVETWELQDEPAHYPNALALTRQTVSIPLFPSLTDGEVEQVIAATLRGLP